MASSSSASLVLPFIISPKTLTFSNASSSSLSLPLLCRPAGCIETKMPISLLSAAFSLLPHKSFNNLNLGRRSSTSSLLVRNVAVSSEYDQDEDVVSEEEEEANFSPDLKLFVGNLPFNVDSSELAGLFVQAGNVQMVEVIYDKTTGRSRGFGFVTMSTIEEVKAAEQQFNGYELGGRPMRVNSGPPPRKDDLSSRGFRVRGGAEAVNRVYVGNLSWGVDDVALESLFSEQGKVMEAKVVYDRDSGRSRGFGFVTYSSAEEVDSAISSLDGVDLKGRAIRVTVAEARPRRVF